jgi:hypothetical protein
MPDDQDIKIAVMQTQIEGLREQHKSHKEEITRSLCDLADKMYSSINGIRSDIKDIYEFINRSRGGIVVLLLCASALGGVVVAVVSWALTRFIK